MKLSALITALFCLASAYSNASNNNAIPAFSSGSIELWQQEKFSGSTQYRLTSQQQVKVLEAIANNSASGLYYKKKIAIDETTTLSWRWKVSKIAEHIDEQSKMGDDYPARIYIVVSDGPFFWQTRTLVYVWSNNQPIDSRWDNAYTRKAQMWAVDSGKEKLNQWQNHSRLLLKDLKTAFGETYHNIEAIAVMTDSDNSGNLYHSWYGDIILK